MKGYVQNIEKIAVKNEDFRQVLYTAKNCQLVIMALKPKEEIWMEVHKLDQFFRVEEGTGEVSSTCQSVTQPCAVILDWMNN
jgi:mannose-6-phosphate isomerase-like protein (cupin superfamily)